MKKRVIQEVRQPAPHRNQSGILALSVENRTLRQGHDPSNSLELPQLDRLIVQLIEEDVVGFPRLATLYEVKQPLFQGIEVSIVRCCQYGSDLCVVIETSRRPWWLHVGHDDRLHGIERQHDTLSPRLHFLQDCLMHIAPLTGVHALDEVLSQGHGRSVAGPRWCRDFVDEVEFLQVCDAISKLLRVQRRGCGCLGGTSLLIRDGDDLHAVL